jgi:hypothetical protein
LALSIQFLIRQNISTPPEKLFAHLAQANAAGNHDGPGKSRVSLHFVMRKHMRFEAE